MYIYDVIYMYKKYETQHHLFKMFVSKILDVGSIQAGKKI